MTEKQPTKILEGHWEKPWAELTESQRAAWEQLFAETIAQDWNTASTNQRKAWVNEFLESIFLERVGLHGERLEERDAATKKPVPPWWANLTPHQRRRCIEDEWESFLATITILQFAALTEDWVRHELKHFQWDVLDGSARQLVAKQREDVARAAESPEALEFAKFLAQAPQEREPEFEFGMFSHKLHADIDVYLESPNVTPRDAALVLCLFNPLDVAAGETPVGRNDKTGPDDFKRLWNVFEDRADAEKRMGAMQIRTLLQWRGLACEMKLKCPSLKYHPWFDRYESVPALTTKVGPSANPEEHGGDAPATGEIEAGRDTTQRAEPATPSIVDDPAHIRYIANLQLEFESAKWKSLLRHCKDRATNLDSPFEIHHGELSLKGTSTPVAERTFSNWLTKARALIREK